MSDRSGDKLLLGIGLLVGALMLLRPQDVEAGTDYQAVFTVTDDAGLPLAGTVVTVGNAQATTDVSGTAVIGLVDPGVYTYTLEHPDFNPFTGSFTVEP